MPTDEADQEGLRGRIMPIGSGGWFTFGAPGLTEGGDQLRWGADKRGQVGRQWVSGTEDILDDFLKVGGRPKVVTGTAILGLAKRWGPLFYGLPRTGGPRLDYYEEPVDAWRRLLGDLRACLTVVERDREDEYVAAQDWSLFRNVQIDALHRAPGSKSRALDTVSCFVPTTLAALREGPLADPSVSGEQLAQAPWLIEPHPDTELVNAAPLHIVARFVDLLLSTAEVHLIWSEVGASRLEVAPRRLIAALGLSIAQGVVVEGKFAICTNCGDLFRPHRVRPGEQAWCEKVDCKQASRRAASARYRQRTRTQAKQGSTE